MQFLRGKEKSDVSGDAAVFPKEAWRGVGEWRVKLADGIKCSAEDVVALIGKAPREILQCGRERVSKDNFFDGKRERVVVVKRYARQGFFQSRSAIHIGSKAERAFRAAQVLTRHGIGTPAPIAVAERWQGKQLVESFLVTEFVADMTNFRDELFRIYRDDPNFGVLIPLMQSVAKACRAFHDCGVVHRDLGNQNISLVRGGSGFKVVFIDLDRVRFSKEISDAERGRDMARIDLPSDLRRIFYSMYYLGYNPPKSFVEAGNAERRAFAWHSALRPLRHPIREYKIRRAERKSAKVAAKRGRSIPVPSGRDLWLWDEKSAQPCHAYMSRDRRKFRPTLNVASAIVAGLVKFGIPAWQEYKKLMTVLPKKCIPDYRNGVGMSLDPNPETWEMQLKFLRELQSNSLPENADLRLPILLGIYHHKPRLWQWTLDRARELHEVGHKVAFALTQSRRAILEPASWAKMVALVFAQAGDFADFVEVGHAVNRTKWGIWSPQEYRALLAPVIESKRRFPRVRITGPACVDFDMHSLPTVLGVTPKDFRFDAISHLLYVDRRGSPENFQGKFDTFRKIALLSVFAKLAGARSEKIIISEVNWPLLGAAEYSPVDSPSVTRGSWETRPVSPEIIKPPRASEEDYATYMARYLGIALSSGFVSRVYWWRLCHHGFGLIDDFTRKNPRPRPAFFTLQKMPLQNYDALT
ncbi:MAG: lipopolysaccharide kinase InaA family protein [Opitutae bacterium]|nr:lipopolysaccharide kinase InaA family protein [Opitutae bacterium]